MSAAPTLRPYQDAQLDAIVDALEAGNNRMLVKSPTGTGKTVTFAAMLQHGRIAAWLQQLPAQKGARMLVIAHREELLDQAAEKIGKANPGLMVSIEQGDRHANRYADVVIASIQTLSAMKFRRLQRLLQWHTPRIVIIDEAHHAAAASYRNALVLLGFLPKADAAPGVEDFEAAKFDDVARMTKALEGWDAVAPRDRMLVGVTATPNRSDAIGLGCVFQTIAYSYNLKDAINDRWLVPIKPWVIETTENLDDVRITAGEFNQKDLAEAVNVQRRNMLALASWRMYAGDRQTLAFTVDVAHAYACAEMWRAAGYRAQAISGETPKEERRQILRDYTAGREQVIFNCMVLTEGTDLPATSCILHLKPTKSATLYEQMTGRGLRLFPGKADCVVIDLVDIARRHSLQAAPVLYGLPPGLKAKGEGLDDLERNLAAFQEKYPQLDVNALGRFTMQELLDRASTFDVWTIPELGAIGAGLACQWIRVGAETFRLQYPWQDGTETLTVQKDMLDHYEVIATFRPHNGPSGAEFDKVRQRTLAAQVTSPQAALQLAEAFVGQERRTVLKLKDRDAPWRTRPASEKQIALLKRLRVPHMPKTMGEASDLIDLAQSRRGR